MFFDSSLFNKSRAHRDTIDSSLQDARPSLEQRVVAAGAPNIDRRRKNAA
jgi:hypothetical protein